MYVWMDVCVKDGWMDGCVFARRVCIYVCIYVCEKEKDVRLAG